jgi:serine/threonine protein kinase
MASHNCILLLESLLEIEPSVRISAKEALRHPFFDTLDKQQLDLFI